MLPSRSLTRGPIRTTTPFFIKTCNISPKFKSVSHLGVPMPRGARLKLTTPTCLGTGHEIPVAEATAAEAAQSFPSSTSPIISPKKKKVESFEENIEKVIYRCRFLAILGVLGSLVGSFLCFIKGCTYVVSSFMEYSLNRAKVIILLVEAIVYLISFYSSLLPPVNIMVLTPVRLRTVMLVFGMGLYELFISNLDAATLRSGEKAPHRSHLFGLFILKERPRWLEIKTVNELKTKLGHVIVMLLLIGFFEKSKTVVILSSVDLLCFSACVLLCSGCLYLLSKLSE